MPPRITKFPILLFIRQLRGRPHFLSQSTSIESHEMLKESMQFLETPESETKSVETPPQIKDGTLETPIPFRPQEPPIKIKTYTLTTVVNHSETLQKLVEMGVSLWRIENYTNCANKFVRLDWDKDVAPVCAFLFKSGVDLSLLGNYLTRNPFIFSQHLDDLQVRVNYLQSKGFTVEAIGRIIFRARYWINIPVKTIDSRLGWLQKEFNLNGDQVRLVVTKCPKLIAEGTGYMETVRFSLLEEFGFTNAQMKIILLSAPKVWITSRPFLTQTFEYLHHQMHIPHKQMLFWPQIFRVPMKELRCRHQFLKKIKRAQYDPNKANYVSLKDLVMKSDSEFCKNVAKCSVSEYNNFLKNE